MEEEPTIDDQIRDEIQDIEASQGELRVSNSTNRAYVSGLNFINKPITYAEVDGDAVFDGDILLGSVEEMEENRQSIESPGDIESIVARGVFVPDARFRWPSGVVPFVINNNLPNQQRVTDAIEQWEEHTNIRFKQRDCEDNYVEFVKGTGCSSFDGMIGGRQVIELADGCTTGSTIHEIGHAVCLWHEQSHEDRDRYISIN